MPLDAKFLADFESFERACKSAELRLGGIEMAAGRVEKSLNRMVDGFSGRRVIQEATLMAEAVDRMGGVTKLTEANLRTVAATAEDAVSHLRALGKEVPDSLDRLARSSSGAVERLNRISGTTAGIERLTTATQGADNAMTGAAKSIREVDNVLDLVGIHAGPARKALDDIGAAAGQSVGQLGRVATAGLALGAAVGGWEIGRAISGFFGLDDAIGRVAARLMGMGNVAFEEASAKTNVLTRASVLARQPISDLAAAMALLSGNAEAHARALNTSAAQIAGWNKELAKVVSDGTWNQLTADIKSQNFSLEELKTRYGISVEAIQFFTREQKKADDELVASSQRRLRALNENLAAQSRQLAENDRVTEAINRLYLAQGRYGDVLSAFSPKLVENVEYYSKLGLSVSEMANILGTALQPKIQTITDALGRQGAAADANRQKLDELRAAQLAQADAQVEARKRIDETNAALERQREAARRAAESVVYTRTYDLSTKQGMEEFRRLNPSAFISQAATPEYFKTHTLADAVNSQLIDLYAGYRMTGRGLAPGSTPSGSQNLPPVVVAGTVAAGGTGVPTSPTTLPLDLARGALSLGPRSINITSNINVSGVMDPRTQRELGDIVEAKWTKALRLTNKLPSA